MSVRERVIATVMGTPYESSAGKGSKPGYGWVEARELDESAAADENHATKQQGERFQCANTDLNSFDDSHEAAEQADARRARLSALLSVPASDTVKAIPYEAVAGHESFDLVVEWEQTVSKAPAIRTPKFSVPDLRLILKLVNEKIAQVKKSEVAEFVQWTGLIVLASTVHAHLVEIGESVG